jgi:hypothetical protein
VGFNAYRYAQRDYGFLEEERWQLSHAGAGADSSLLFVLATTGILGLGAYLKIWLKVLEKSGSKKNRLLVLTVLGVLLSHSLFLNSLFYPWIMAWLWLVLATGNS